MIAPGAARRVELFASHAAIALAYARRGDEQAVSPASPLIGPAVGVLMERCEISEDRAASYLIRVATVAELPLQDVAHEVLREVGGRAD